MKTMTILRVWLTILPVGPGLVGAQELVAQETSGAAAACTAERRAEVLRSMQAEVQSAVPVRVESLAEAAGSGGVLDGWRLSHGLVVLAGAGAVAVDNIEAEPPVPPVLLYAPSAGSRPEDWLDFDGDDGPYELAGWAYLVPWTEGSTPPEIPCVQSSEWFVHEAGWHLMDGGMAVTREIEAEPPPPTTGPAGYFWHPRGWDVHFWRGEDGVPEVTFHNPRAGPGGLPLPQEAFYYLVDGERVPPPPPPEE